ncbi:WD-40 repeat-containing protein [Reticulomyxa filosa]|uniref:WD-40 repeat-containing protein n=1 Tax=Reticulomyxa filosa TaxID=46433 RepID=X6LL77_RETFI|nr:WD-40 repeat-containing protein [Reticulomyxa filosa]|eukprot:ETO02713.1 WD-40 repeat-containing protein [Reticulomyxa filosa]
MFETFLSSSKLTNTFTGHTKSVRSIDYSTFDDRQFIYSGSRDKTVCVWDVDNDKQIQSFDGHSSTVLCVKFSLYHYHNHHQNVICSSSYDKTIRFWDFKHNEQLQIFNEHTDCVCGIEFSPFNGGRYLCSGSYDKTICVLIFHHYKNNKNDNNNNKMNNIGVIGGNGYTICSGSFDKTIRIWDIETTKQFNVFKGHDYYVMSIKYGSNELLNTILSGSLDKSVRLWDIRSGQQIQMFNGHTNDVWCVEYSPFNELYMIKGDEKEDDGIYCLKFIELKKKDKTKNIKYDLNLCYGSAKGLIRICG